MAKAINVTGSKKRWNPNLFTVAQEVMGFEGLFASLEGALGQVHELLKEELPDVGWMIEEDTPGGVSEIIRLLKLGDVTGALNLFNSFGTGHSIEVQMYRITKDLRPGKTVYIAENHRLDETPVLVIFSTREELEQEERAMFKRLGGKPEGYSSFEVKLHP